MKDDKFSRFDQIPCEMLKAVSEEIKENYFRWLKRSMWKDVHLCGAVPESDNNFYSQKVNN